MKDWYRILQVRSDAEAEVIAAAFRALAKKHHPDLNPSPEAHSRMQTLNAAYAVLGNPIRREIYDRKRESGEREVSPERKKSSPQARKEEILQGCFQVRSGENLQVFRFYADGLVLIRTYGPIDHSRTVSPPERLHGSSYDSSGSYWLAGGLIEFATHSDSGPEQFTGRVTADGLVLRKTVLASGRVDDLILEPMGRT